MQLQRRSITLREDFSGIQEPPSPFDGQRWVAWQGGLRTERGYGLQEALRPPPRGPGEMVFALFGTKEKYFTAGLGGTNGVEITLVDYLHETGYPKIPEDSLLRGHVMGWGLTLASWHGQLGAQKSWLHDRGVQLHMDLMGKRGLYISLVRGVVTGDWSRYPWDGLFLDSALRDGAITEEAAKTLPPTEWSLDVTDALMKRGSFISYPCLVMACRSYPADLELHRRGHRFGLFLADDGNRLAWTLNGEEMDEFDISGYFDSSPDSVRDGAYLTVGGAGCFQSNTWVIDDITMYAS